MAGFHPLLGRQLKRCFGSIEAVPEVCRPLVDIVNEAYKQADTDRLMLERSLELSSEELGELNTNLRRAVLELQAAHRGMEARVLERTTALEAANEHLRQAHKMEAVGKLAGGIAHDFNNLLTVIDGCTEVLLDGRTASDPDRLELEEIHKATERAADLTQQLLAFSRKQVLDPKIIDLNVVVLGMQTMLQRLIREDIAVRVNAAPVAAWVRLDPNQIEQVVLNLVLNARDALPHGGNIRIDVAHERPVPAPTDSAPGSSDVVRLRVCDDGVGMTPEVRTHIFEPFFTTKMSGKGTGLGLASVYGIVHQSNGIITVDSAEGRGTTFTMFFPVASPGSAAPGASTERSDAAKGNAETVMLVEDEHPVRRVIRTMLERGGYRVIEAPTAREACALFDERRSEIDILVTDVIMPEMNGPALARRLLSLRPDLPVLFISGHSDVESSLLGLGSPRVAFLAKPLQAARLTTKIRELLAQV